MENISNILSSTASTNRKVSEVSRGAFHFPVGAPPFQHYQLALQEVFLTSIWPRRKVQWVALNLSLQRKGFAQLCALSQTVEAAKKIDHDLVNREFSNKVVKKWLWKTLRLTFVSNICHYIFNNIHEKNFSIVIGEEKCSFLVRAKSH